MKRHHSLIPFSQEHHHTLSLCARILRAPEENYRQEINRHFVDLQRHFADEEKMFAPLREKLNCENLYQQFINEHRQIIALYQQADFENADWNIQLATLLRRHVRFEEREFFPALETVL